MSWPWDLLVDVRRALQQRPEMLRTPRDIDTCPFHIHEEDVDCYADSDVDSNDGWTMEEDYLGGLRQVDMN